MCFYILLQYANILNVGIKTSRTLLLNIIFFETMNHAKLHWSSNINIETEITIIALLKHITTRLILVSYSTVNSGSSLKARPVIAEL